MTMQSARTQNLAPGTASVIRIPGYRLTITPDGGRVLSRAVAVGAGVRPVEAIRCVSCAHLKGMDLPSSGKVITCRLGYWAKPDGKVLWLTPQRLLTTMGPIARVASGCLDHSPQETSA